MPPPLRCRPRRLCTGGRGGQAVQRVAAGVGRVAAAVQGHAVAVGGDAAGCPAAAHQASATRASGPGQRRIVGDAAGGRAVGRGGIAGAHASGGVAPCVSHGQPARVVGGGDARAVGARAHRHGAVVLGVVGGHLGIAVAGSQQAGGGDDGRQHGGSGVERSSHGGCPQSVCGAAGRRPSACALACGRAPRAPGDGLVMRINAAGCCAAP